ncbi:hypothetical protein P175DRAFT_0501734 [Aspergillus ochraceoroseus IBT 24754]|uniref:RWD domain-containing protein n=1 Tax=Aspergillus ochraceoroseus IBT 24754 TaxID=1392256 RepID=A0A2T5LXT0_9EURO|nr:uncharacterized protein P175DRAFT_0501734 [Aspergillus ochraceoroseus IBT 24754]PTU21098.1 hypothetical protein P175DRAFT_0501734 [Aspergillus ochraceoroseus IBT 24754]
MSSLLESLANTDLAEEIEAINAIYDPDTITITSTTPTATTPPKLITLENSSSSSSSSETPSTTTTTIKLQIPNHPHLSFLVGFESSYPDTPPKILGTASTASRGEGKIAIDVLENILDRTYQPGAVCLFDLINEAVEAFEELSIGGESSLVSKENPETSARHEDSSEAAAEAKLRAEDLAALSLHDSFGLSEAPNWVLSDVVTEKKSVFVGRAARVTSLDQAQGFLDYLLAVDRKVAAATHNISAWRIRQRGSFVAGGGGGGGKEKAAGGESAEMIVQDCDDDGETAAGGRLLHLMQLMDVWDVVVVVTRWYGGVLLGPDRFRIINAVGRDALLKGGFVKEKESGSANEKGKKKGKK